MTYTDAITALEKAPARVPSARCQKLPPEGKRADPPSPTLLAVMSTSARQAMSRASGYMRSPVYWMSMARGERRSTKRCCTSRLICAGGLKTVLSHSE